MQIAHDANAVFLTTYKSQANSRLALLLCSAETSAAKTGNLELPPLAFQLRCCLSSARLNAPEGAG